MKGIHEARGPVRYRFRMQDLHDHYFELVRARACFAPSAAARAAGSPFCDHTASASATTKKRLKRQHQQQRMDDRRRRPAQNDLDYGTTRAGET
jgi:hypothetical protein